MVSVAILDMIASLYNSTFTIIFAITNLTIFLLLVRKVVNFLLAREEKRNGSYALITGCDSGFGFATAYELNKRDIHVFAACLTRESVQKFNDDDNFKGTAFVMNVTKKEDIEAAKCMIEEVVKEEGLWCLFNNAGIGEPGPIEWLSEEDMLRTIDVNLWGAVNVTKAMLPMLKKARGRIVNTTSAAGRIVFPYLSPYHISKYAFEAFSDSLRYEMKPWGVSVHIIEPGFMKTDILLGLDKRWKGLWDNQTKEVREAYGEEFINRILKSIDKVSKVAGNPKKVVNAYLHAALSTRPQLRYLVGLDAKIMATIALLPTYMADFLVNFQEAKPVGRIA